MKFFIFMVVLVSLLSSCRRSSVEESAGAKEPKAETSVSIRKAAGESVLSEEAVIEKDIPVRDLMVLELCDEFRMNPTVATPTETLGDKFASLNQGLRKRYSGLKHDPIEISPEVAKAVVQGWPAFGKPPEGWQPSEIPLVEYLQQQCVIWHIEMSVTVSRVMMEMDLPDM